ncbi:katanin p80 WD40 repeat-containing subunit B1-like [Sarcoptes scabiei]|nr:katanin p80 WD40 repeat-containing subunit B1-like [Sarcoptes scabiei]
MFNRKEIKYRWSRLKQQLYIIDHFQDHYDHRIRQISPRTMFKNHRLKTTCCFESNRSSQSPSIKTNVLSRKPPSSSTTLLNQSSIKDQLTLILVMMLLMLFTVPKIEAQQQSRSIVHRSSSSYTPLPSYQTMNDCMGEWQHPSNCTMFDCDYKATWEYRDENDEIIFSISTRNRNKWTGIGFSENQAMPETDAILGLVEESGRFFLMDSYLRAYEAPPLDQQQNLYNMSAWRENGLTTLRFSRPRRTGDPRDYQFSDTDCPYFIFPVMGGVFNAVNKRIRKHESIPIISDRRVCVRSCRRSPAIETIPPTMTTMKTSIPITIADRNSNKQSMNEYKQKEKKINQKNINNIEHSKAIDSSDYNQPGIDHRQQTYADNDPQQKTASNIEKTKEKIYQAEFKFLNLQDSNQQSNRNNFNENNLVLNQNNDQDQNKQVSEETIKQIEDSLLLALRKQASFDRIKAIKITELKRNDPIQTIAMIDLILTNDNYGDLNHKNNFDNNNNRQKNNDDAIVIDDERSKDVDEEQSRERQDIRDLTNALQSLINDGRIGRWQVDNNHLVVTAKESKSNGWLDFLFTTFNRFNEEEQKWIIIGAGLSALILLALIQLFCMFCTSCNCCCGNDGGGPNSNNNLIKQSDHMDYLNEKDIDKHWSNDHYPPMIYRADQLQDPRSMKYGNNYGHTSLERRQYNNEQQRSRQSGGYEMNERFPHNNHHHHHHHHPFNHRIQQQQQSYQQSSNHHHHQMQPDFYFMPHQRKYSSDVVRVYVDYDGNN